jgi:hypothetical protein
MEYSSEDDAYYVGMGHLSSIFKIDRFTGETLWKMGGIDSDFVFSEGSEHFMLNHNFDISDDVLTLFVNGTGLVDPSRVLVYEIDQENLIAEESWRYEPAEELYVYALGDVARIAPDTINVTWSTAGLIEQVDGDERSWSLSVDFPHAFGYSNFMQSLYPEISL